ncbi:MAG TPA: hypothetical protein VMF06_21515 [Candidatus Limnocylindria bacterium]|jgi:hypothetical protein|nr:hypothetical protein [Candidatus Limnocylindria bacterium]
MPQILHILTTAPDDTAQEIIGAQQGETANVVTTIDLTKDTPDYTRVVNAIFESDSITVW